MNNERLIEAVRRFPALYDTSDSKYMDTNYKSSIWIKIAEEMKQTDENCKKRWANIRDQFKRSLNKRKSKNGQSATVIKKYKYEETLQFLLPHMHERNTKSKFDDGVSQYINDSESEIQNEHVKLETGSGDEQEIHEIEIKTEEEALETETQNELWLENTKTQNKQESVTQHIRGKRFNRLPKNDTTRIWRNLPRKPTTSDALMKYILENSAKKQLQKESHPMDDFFRGLSSTVKTFSPYHQHLAKGRLFAVVQELELEQMFEASSSTSSTSAPTPILLNCTEVSPLPATSTVITPSPSDEFIN